MVEAIAVGLAFAAGLVSFVSPCVMPLVPAYGELRLMRAAPGVRGPLGDFLLGLGFATGWTPCIGVTLGAVLSTGAVSGATLTGFLQIVAYCAGLGVPFLGIALLLERALPALQALSRRRRVIDWGSAGVVAAMGVLLMTNNLTSITQRLTELLPRGLLSPLGL